MSSTRSLTPPPPSQNDKSIISVNSDNCSIGSSSSESLDVIHYSTEELLNSLEIAIGIKIKGNIQFKLNHFNSSLEFYELALNEIPLLPRNQKLTSITETLDSEKGKQVESQDEGIWNQLKELKVTLLSNSAACHLNLKNFTKAIEACSAALEIDPAHLKSLQRRASSNEKALNYSEALEDLKTLKQNGHASKKEDSNIIRLEKLLLDKSARDREEVMSKLKELGNGLLGKFGMSLDNFVSKPSEGGGYSLNFKP